MDRGVNNFIFFVFWVEKIYIFTSRNQLIGMAWNQRTTKWKWEDVQVFVTTSCPVGHYKLQNLGWVHDVFCSFEQDNNNILCSIISWLI